MDKGKIIFSLLVFFIQNIIAFSASIVNLNYDVVYYQLDISVFPENKSIKGSTSILFKSLTDVEDIKVKLAHKLLVDSIMENGKKLEYTRSHDTILIHLSERKHKNNHGQIQVFYHGFPHVALNPPWQGGFIWSKDSLDNDWVGVACEGEGASLWWPCKDEPSDEPDSMRINVTCPSQLYCVSNGVLEKVEKHDHLSTYHWMVHYPINHYDVTINLGKYAHFSDTLVRKDKSKLTLDYYVLNYNFKKAQIHFRQVKPVLSGLEHYFGNYPFPIDGYALVETPYWGMEHQSAIAYGNNYRKNMQGLDFIIVHETAHEWWGNSVTAQSMSELWIHEAFATYAESLLLEHLNGEEMANDYLLSQRAKIKNEAPMLLSKSEIQPEGTDIYYKGTWMLQTMRTIVNNDKRWFKIISDFAKSYSHKITNTEEVISYFNKKSGKNLTPVFNHYLYRTKLPEFHYIVSKEKNNRIRITYNWQNVDKDFKMPVWIYTGDQKILLNASSEIKKKNIKILGENETNVVKVNTQLQLIDVVEGAKFK